jgi:hypothetical protein
LKKWLVITEAGNNKCPSNALTAEEKNVVYSYRLLFSGKLQNKSEINVFYTLLKWRWTDGRPISSITGFDQLVLDKGETIKEQHWQYLRLLLVDL